MKSDFVPTDHKWLRLPDETVATYNTHDTYLTARLIPALKDILTRNGQWDYYQKWFGEMAPVVERMQARGVGDLDLQAKKVYRARLRKELDDIEKPILELAPFLTGLADEAHRWAEDTLREHPKWEKKVAIGLASRLRKAEKRRSGFFNRAGGEGSTDLSKLLFDHLGLKPAPVAKGRPHRSTGQDALFYILQHLRQKDEPHRKVLEDLFHRARLNTILTRYTVVDCDLDGRVRPLIKLAGTETLRLAYSGDAGEAIQQWPSEVRHLIKARTGYLYCSRDYSQLEARLMAYYAQDTGMLEVFAKGGDVHFQNAIDLGLVTQDSWDKMGVVSKAATRNFAKCLHPDTWVEMHDGTQRIAQTLKPGEWTSRGQIIASQSIGPAKLLEIRTSAGDRTIVTEEHPFYTDRGWVMAKDLIGDTACGGRRSGGHKLTTLSKPSNPELNYPDEFFRVLGYLIGDGGTTAGIVFTNVDREIVDEFIRCVSVLEGTVRQIDNQSYQVSGLGWVVDTWGLRGVKAIHKEIPEVVWRASWRQREIFLTALWEADGTTSKYATSLASSSWKLMKGVHLMLNQMDIPGTICHKTDGAWIRYISARGRAKAHFWPFVLERKRPHRPTRARAHVVQVTEIIDRGIGEAWGLQIDSGEHVTDGLLTHNSFLYGLGYGGSPETMKTKTYCPCPRCVDDVPPTLDLGRDAIRRASDRWAEKHQPILRWRSQLVESIKGYGGDHSWTSPWGYRRFFLEPRSQAERSIYNYPMQHGGSQIVNAAMVSLDAVGAPLVLQMHDELMLEVPVGEVAHWDGAMRETMEAPVRELGGAVFPTSGGRGYNWGEVKS